MVKRLLFILRLYITLLLIFVTQKLVFMLFNLPSAAGTTVGGWAGVLLHGLRLDSVTACYLMAVPVLVVLVSFFWWRMPVRRVLTCYYALAAPLMALAFAADMVLYRFWGAKMDAADLIYAANPKDMLASLTLPAIFVGGVLLALLVFHYLRRLRHATPEGFDRVHPASSAVMLAVVALQFVGIRGGLSDSTANVSYAYFSSTPFLRPPPQCLCLYRRLSRRVVGQSAPHSRMGQPVGGLGGRWQRHDAQRQRGSAILTLEPRGRLLFQLLRQQFSNR